MILEKNLDQKLQDKLSMFLLQYGTSALEHALDMYVNSQQEYICKTRTSISKFKIHDIDYIKIQKHHMSIYTQKGVYHKYGSLTKELNSLSTYAFIQCAQNCIVSLYKIKSITQNTIILTDNTVIHMSRKYASSVIMAFTFRKPLQK